MVGSVMQTIAKHARPPAVQDFTGPAQPLIFRDKRKSSPRPPPKKRKGPPTNFGLIIRRHASEPFCAFEPPCLPGSFTLQADYFRIARHPGTITKATKRTTSTASRYSTTCVRVLVCQWIFGHHRGWPFTDFVHTSVTWIVIR